MLPEIQNGDVLYVAPVSARKLLAERLFWSKLVGDGMGKDGGKLRAHRLSKDVRGDRFVTRRDASLSRMLRCAPSDFWAELVRRKARFPSTIRRTMVTAVGQRNRL